MNPNPADDHADTGRDPSGSATIVFARKVAPSESQKYEAWLSAVSEAAAGFAGYTGTTIVRPATAQDEYVALVQFDDTSHLDAWLRSDARHACLDNLEQIGIEREEITTLGGLEHWVSHLGTLEAPPPRWKTAILILGGLYPIVLLQAWIINPELSGLPLPVGALITLIGSVALMVWVILPTFFRLLARWLGGKAARSRQLAIADRADAQPQ
jgi:antibiotic biosynthesis monooxygenase (ABM) superfamily enzyme